MDATYIDGHGRRCCMVTGKVCHGTRAEAEAVRVETGRRSRLYRCGHCGHVHWGSSPRPVGVTPPARRRASRGAGRG